MIKSPTPSNNSDKENQAPKKKYSKMVNADSTVISSDEDIPLAKINLKSPGKSPKKNGNLSNGKSDFSKISNNKKSVSSSDDDAPLSVLKPKLKNMKKKQPTLFDLANKNKGKFKLVEKTTTKNSSESRSKSPRNLKTAAPRHHKLITEAIKIWKKHEKAVQLNKTNEQQRIKKALYMLISKIVRELNTNKQKHHIENCRNQVIKDLINQKIAKVNYENLTPEEKKKIRDEKRKKQEEERRNEKLAAENLMVDDCLLDCDPEKKLNYKGLKLISSSPKFYEKYINLPKEYVHLFPDILTTYQFLKGHASYLSITGMTTRDFKKHFTLKNWIVSIKDKVQTQNKLFMRICLCLIRTKLSKKITNIPVFEEYNIDLSDVCMRKHLNKDLFCFIVYNYLEFRYQENFQAEESYKERKAKEKIENDSKRGEDSDNEDDDGGQSEVSSVSNAEDLEDEMLENESAKYKTILDTLSAFNNDFDLLDIDSKLDFISLLIDEHLNSPELRDYQDNFEENMKADRRSVRESKIELKKLTSDLIEMEKDIETENTEAGGKFYSRRIRDAQNQKSLNKIKKEIDKLTEYIELTENNIKELEMGIWDILRLDPLGYDRHSRTHWFFSCGIEPVLLDKDNPTSYDTSQDLLPIILEVPNNKNHKTGQIMNTQWYFIDHENDGLQDYLAKADLESRYEEKFRKTNDYKTLGYVEKKETERSNGAISLAAATAKKNSDKISDIDLLCSYGINEKELKGNLQKFGAGIEKIYSALKVLETPSESTTVKEEEDSIESSIEVSLSPKALLLTFLERATYSNSINFHRCLDELNNQPITEEERHTEAFPEIQLKMVENNFNLPLFIKILLKHTYIKAIDNSMPLAERDLREKLNNYIDEKIENEAEFTESELSFLVFLYQISLNFVSLRRGRRSEKLRTIIENDQEEDEEERIKIEEEQREIEVKESARERRLMERYNTKINNNKKEERDNRSSRRARRGVVVQESSEEEEEEEEDVEKEENDSDNEESENEDQDQMQDDAESESNENEASSSAPENDDSNDDDFQITKNKSSKTSRKRSAHFTMKKLIKPKKISRRPASTVKKLKPILTPTRKSSRATKVTINYNEDDDNLNSTKSSVETNGYENGNGLTENGNGYHEHQSSDNDSNSSGEDENVSGNESEEININMFASSTRRKPQH